LDEVHPFSDTDSVDLVLRESEHILSPHLDAVGRRNAARIWGFMSKFAMLDRFIKTLGVEKLHPGIPVPRNVCSTEYLGTGLKVDNLFQNSTTLLIQLDIGRY
jgi:hypothetical protein